jgi:hypothetical protein
MNEYPISATCPQCGGTEYARRKPSRLVAFVSDRVCRACNTRYTPPTPPWAVFVFLVSGLALPVLGAFLTILLVPLFSLAGLVCEGLFVALGIAAFVGGIRQLVNSERARSRGDLGLQREKASGAVLPGSTPSESSPS